MKTSLHLATLAIYLFTFAASRSTVSTESSYEIGYREPVVNQTAEKILYDVVYKAIASPSPKLISNIKYKLKNIGAWIAQRENEGTFIGRCFGVARQIKFAMPIIMLKLGVIVTILIFLTVFSMKTVGLLLIMFMFGASSVFTKLALWKQEYVHHQKPQDVHFHIHQGKHGGYKYSQVSSPWDITSGENYKDNFVESHADFQDKLNYLSQYQKGQHMYSSQ